MKRPAIRPMRWTPPPAPIRVRHHASLPPMPSLTIHLLPGHGPEDVVVDEEGRIITGVDDGRVLRLSADGRIVETVADTGGRPLGIELCADGTLVVCDTTRGLLRVDPVNGNVTSLTSMGAGVSLRFCNNAAVANDGAVYFSDSSLRFGIEQWRADLVEHSETGRLLRCDPDGSTELLAEGLSFANGVALSADESWVAVAETGAYRITRVWLRGARKGEQEILVDNLPGFPDNISRGSDGLIWVALASPRDPVLDRLLPRAPVLRRVAWALPQRLQPQPRRTVWVQAYQEDGSLVHDLQCTHPRFHLVTGVRERAGTVYLGSLVGRSVATFQLPSTHPDHD